jgi:membrane protease YdiL (CAAX protease family)
MPNTRSLVGTLLIAPAWVVLSLQLGVWWNEILPFPKEFAEILEKALGLNPDANALWLLFVIALSPAICEEALFRGPLISAFRGRLPNWLIICIGGGAFGVFHLSIYRVFPTAMTGFVFTWLVLHTRSIVTSAIAHLVLNGTIVLVATQHLPNFILAYLRDAETKGIPTWLLGGAAVVFVAGVLLVMRGGAIGQEASG